VRDWTRWRSAIKPVLIHVNQSATIDHVKVFANEEAAEKEQGAFAVSTQPVGLASGRFRVHIGGMEKTIISLALIAAVIVVARWTLRGRK
jgi:hypothetical protein